MVYLSEIPMPSPVGMMNKMLIHSNLQEIPAVGKTYIYDEYHFCEYMYFLFSDSLDISGTTTPVFRNLFVLRGYTNPMLRVV